MLTPCIEHRNIAKEHRDISKEHRDISKQHWAITKQHWDITKEQFQTEQEEQRRREEETCHQLFRLTNNERDVTYEWYKDRVEKRLENTCLWFLQHEHFQTWLKQDSGLLLVTADPGCGKSVLARYLIDEVLLQSGTTICYFFFKDQDQNTIRQALCALLHQLFTQEPYLIKYAIKEYRKDGAGLINSTEKLWQILQDAIKDPAACSVIVVLDALDECIESQFKDLIRQVEKQFRSAQRGKLKYMLTCRPYEAIISEFHNLLRYFPKIRIPGEEESEAISWEVDHVVQHRLSQLSKIKNFSTEITNYLKKKLQETTHRTYLWVYLVFDYLEKENFKKTLKGVKCALVTLPQTVNEAYERILSKSKQDPMVRRVLNIVFAAERPLRLAEMNAAVNIDILSRTIDLEREEDLKFRLRSWCGLFISIYRDNIYFIHQTAREFLQSSSPTSIPTNPERWQHSIHIHQAHAILMEICQAYLIHMYSMLENDGINPSQTKVYEYLSRYAFLDYAAQFGALHIREFEAQKAAFPGLEPQTAIVNEVSEELNALYSKLEFYFRSCNEKAVFKLAMKIAGLAVYSMPQDHPSRVAMIRNFRNRARMYKDSQFVMLLMGILYTMPLKRSSRGYYIRQLVELSTKLRQVDSDFRIISFIMYMIPLDHPDRLTALNFFNENINRDNSESISEDISGRLSLKAAVWPGFYRQIPSGVSD